jgi:hypothetical protein
MTNDERRDAWAWEYLGGEDPHDHGPLVREIIHPDDLVAAMEAEALHTHDRVARWAEHGCPLPDDWDKDPAEFIRAGLPGWQG